MYFSRFLCASCLPVYIVDNLKQSSTVAGVAISCIGLGKVVMDIPSGLLSNRFNSGGIMIGSAALMAGGSWLAARSSGLLTLAFGLLIFGMGMSLTKVSWQLLLSSRIEKNPTR